MKWYVIMKHTFENAEDLNRFKKGNTNVKNKIEDTPDLGMWGTGGNPSNHFPSCRVKMHELQKAESNPCILYRIHSTSY